MKTKITKETESIKETSQAKETKSMKETKSVKYVKSMKVAQDTPTKGRKKKEKKSKFMIAWEKFEPNRFEVVDMRAILK